MRGTLAFIILNRKRADRGRMRSRICGLVAFQGPRGFVCVHQNLHFSWFQLVSVMGLRQSIKEVYPFL